MTIDYRAKDLEIQAKRLSKVADIENEMGFQEGLQAVVVDPISSEEEQKKDTKKLIDNAKEEAAKILAQAKEQARQIKEDALKEARKQGFEEGLKKGNLEIEKIKNNLKEDERQQKEEYQALLAGIEGQVAEVIASLVTKLTGILVEDKKDIIHYLVEKTLRDNSKLESYTIRVSEDDYEALSLKKDYLVGIVDKDIEIIVDSKLGRNQCLIETENIVIDCSLDVQLKNLIRDIRMLASI